MAAVEAMMALTGEHIWIIGASSGIGEALAKELDRQGARLILSARRKEQLEHLNQNLEGQHIVEPLDVADYEQIAQAVRSITDQISKIDRIVFLAALYEPSDIDRLDMGFVKQLVEVNLLGAIYTSHIALARFDQQEGGQLV